jgi:phage repressor protein C with HTH and peptisase S24 domain
MNRLKQALKERRMSAEELAQAVGMKGAAIRRYVRGEIQPTIDLAARIAAALEMDEGELWGVASATSAATTGRTVPVYGAAAAGTGEDISDVSSPLEYQPAPPPVRGAGYGVIVAGDSMSPRLQTADVVFASPGNPLRPGDLCVVQYKTKRGETLAIVKQFCSWSAEKLVLEQLTPAKKITLPRADALRIDRVVATHHH